MSVYKVPQDVEADDKLIGPFSFKQFVFILLGLGLAWMSFILGQTSPFLFIIPMPLALGFITIGLPLRKDQPTDVYVAALINFWLRPKTRLWNQEGMTEHVRVTAPMRDPHQRTDGLSRTEVESRLTNLAKTLDTRGWVIKNANVPIYMQAGLLTDESDRLVAPTLVAGPTVQADESGMDDILDADNSRIAQRIADIQAHGHTPGPIVQPREETAVENPVAGTVVTPGGEQYKPRTIAEIAAIADARNPDGAARETIAPLFQGTRNREEGAKLAPSPQPLAPSEEKIEIPRDLHFDPKPAMDQKIIQPVHEDVKPEKISDTSEMTDTAQTDILEPLNGSVVEDPPKPTEGDLDEGGEVSLR